MHHQFSQYKVLLLLFTLILSLSLSQLAIEYWQLSYDWYHHCDFILQFDDNVDMVSSFLLLSFSLSLSFIFCYVFHLDHWFVWMDLSFEWIFFLQNLVNITTILSQIWIELLCLSIKCLQFIVVCHNFEWSIKTMTIMKWRKKWYSDFFSVDFVN